jgi:peptidoglycan/LPS O-acetylase OafA/YrhL
VATSQTSSRIPELDGLRGIAIVLVVLFHCFYVDLPALKHPAGFVDQVYVWLRTCVGLGWTGVDLFFVLSGFLIGGILLDVRDSPSYYKTFYARRFYRIVPIYYLWLLAYIFLLLTLRGVIAPYYADPFDPSLKGGVLWLFVFVQGATFTRYALGSMWLQLTWSLAVEEQFYLVAPLLIRWLSRRRLTLFLGGIVIAAPLLRMWVRFHEHPFGLNLHLAYTLMPCRADALAIGVLGALYWRQPALRSWLSERSWLLYALTGTFLAGVLVLGRWSPNNYSLPMQSVGYTWFALFYGLLLSLALEKPRGLLASVTRTKWLGAVGRVSYCIYLIHYAVWWVFRTFLFLAVRRLEPWKLTATTLAALITIYAIARMSWRDIEHPLLRRGQTYQY